MGIPLRAPLLLSLALLVVACGEESPRHDDADDVMVCRERLRTIHRALVERARETGEPPSKRGEALFDSLVSDGTWPDDEEHRTLLSCPGAGVAEGARSGYAGRDVAAHPFPAFPTGGDEVVMACANRGGMNHDGVTNVLYADGSVVTLVLERLVERGRLGAGAATIPVGPDSPLEELRALTLE